MSDLIANTTTVRQAANVLCQRDVRLTAHASASTAARLLDESALETGEIVMLLRGSGGRFALNLTGAVIWDALQEPQTLNSLVDVTLRAFPDAPRDQLEHTTTLFVDELVRLDLVDVVA